MARNALREELMEPSDEGTGPDPLPPLVEQLKQDIYTYAPVEATEANLQAILTLRHPLAARELLLVLDDPRPFRDHMWLIVHALESLPKRRFLEALAETFGDSSRYWTDTILGRLVESPADWGQFLAIAADRADSHGRRAISGALARIREKRPELRERCDQAVARLGL
jgi:hypothetical protein